MHILKQDLDMFWTNDNLLLEVNDMYLVWINTDIFVRNFNDESPWLK